MASATFEFVFAGFLEKCRKNPGLGRLAAKPLRVSVDGGLTETSVARGWLPSIEDETDARLPPSKSEAAIGGGVVVILSKEVYAGINGLVSLVEIIRIMIRTLPANWAEPTLRFPLPPLLRRRGCRGRR